MNTIVTDWSYLELEGDQAALRRRASGGTVQLTEAGGDYCGEWGAILDHHGKPIGVRLFFFFDYLPDHPLAQAKNCRRHEDELRVYVEDARLPDIDQMPFLPVTRNALPAARDIFQLSGYDD